MTHEHALKDAFKKVKAEIAQLRVADLQLTEQIIALNQNMQQLLQMSSKKSAKKKK